MFRGILSNLILNFIIIIFSKLSDNYGRGEAATFLKKLSDCEVKEGQKAKLTACVGGFPTPEIKWLVKNVF